MMEYIPGVIHESFQKIHVIEALTDFVITVLNNRWVDTNFVLDEGNYIDISLNKGDLIFIRYYKPKLNGLYAYLEKVVRIDGVVIDVMKESILSYDLIKINENIFSDVTQQYERDKKIEKILQ